MLAQRERDFVDTDRLQIIKEETFIVWEQSEIKFYR